MNRVSTYSAIITCLLVLFVNLPSVVFSQTGDAMEKEPITTKTLHKPLGAVAIRNMDHVLKIYCSLANLFDCNSTDPESIKNLCISNDDDFKFIFSEYINNKLPFGGFIHRDPQEVSDQLIPEFCFYIPVKSARETIVDLNKILTDEEDDKPIISLLKHNHNGNLFSLGESDLVIISRGDYLCLCSSRELAEMKLPEAGEFLNGMLKDQSIHAVLDLGVFPEVDQKLLLDNYSKALKNAFLNNMEDKTRKELDDVLGNLLIDIFLDAFIKSIKKIDFTATVDETTLLTNATYDSETFAESEWDKIMKGYINNNSFAVPVNDQVLYQCNINHNLNSKSKDVYSDLINQFQVLADKNNHKTDKPNSVNIFEEMKKALDKTYKLKGIVHLEQDGNFVKGVIGIYFPLSFDPNPLVDEFIKQHKTPLEDKYNLKISEETDNYRDINFTRFHKKGLEFLDSRFSKDQEYLYEAGYGHDSLWISFSQNGSVETRNKVLDIYLNQQIPPHPGRITSLSCNLHPLVKLMVKNSKTQNFLANIDSKNDSIMYFEEYIDHQYTFHLETEAVGYKYWDDYNKNMLGKMLKTIDKKLYLIKLETEKLKKAEKNDSKSKLFR